MTPGERIRTLREELKMPMVELAKAADMRPEYLEQIEDEEVTGVHTRTYQKLADILNVRLAYILGDEDIPRKVRLEDEVQPEYLWFILVTMRLVIILGVLCLSFLLLALGSTLVTVVFQALLRNHTPLP